VETKVLTPLQAKVLILLFDNGIGARGYYFTGGSALAEFYLQHRYSDDLDLFTRSARGIKEDYTHFKQILTSQNFEIISSDEEAEFVRFSIQSSDEKSVPLKVELARDAKVQMSSPTLSGKIIVDSFEDIAVNKICAILGREPPEPKDFVDLFFILQESAFTLDYLVERAKEKEAAFDREDGVLFFAINLMRVKEFRLLPRMIKPLVLDDLQSFLFPKAEAIVKRLRPVGSS
jgi:hypothetical protein